MNRTLQTLLISIFCSSSNAKQAIVLGGTGLVGGKVVQHMLKSNKWKKIHLVVRKSSKFQNESKINEIVIPDLNNMEKDSNLLSLERGKIEAAIVTLGVNEAFGWTAQKLFDIEVGLTSKFANYCHAHLDVNYISLLSGCGADRENPLTEKELKVEVTYWNVFSIFPQIKGSVESAIVKSGIPYMSFFQPANFETDEYRFGILDVVLQNLFKVLNYVIPSHWHSIHVDDIATAFYEDADMITDENMNRTGSVKRGQPFLMYKEMMSLAVKPKTEL